MVPVPFNEPLLMLNTLTVSVRAVPVSKIPPETVTGVVSTRRSLAPSRKVPKFTLMPPVVPSVLESLTVPVFPLEPMAIALLLVVQVPVVKSTVPPVAACRVAV